MALSFLYLESLLALRQWPRSGSRSTSSSSAILAVKVPSPGDTRLQPENSDLSPEARVRLVSKINSKSIGDEDCKKKMAPKVPKRPLESRNSPLSVPSEQSFSEQPGCSAPTNTNAPSGSDALNDQQPGSGSQDRFASYYEMDVWLQKRMTAETELSEALERLQETKRELELTKKKYEFLCETSYSNRILANSFKTSTYEKYVRLISARKAVEETVRNTRARLKQARSDFETARAQYEGAIKSKR